MPVTHSRRQLMSQGDSGDTGPMSASQDTMFLLDVDNTLKMVLINTGKQMYELDEHAALMVKFPAMEHNEAYRLFGMRATGFA